MLLSSGAEAYLLSSLVYNIPARTNARSCTALSVRKATSVNTLTKESELMRIDKNTNNIAHAITAFALCDSNFLKEPYE